MTRTDRTATGLHALPRLRRAGRLASISFVMQLLSACAGGAPATFDLSVPGKGVAGRAMHGQLVVSEPTAAAPLDGDRIVVRTGSQSLELLKDAQWVDPLPRLMQARLVQTFENDHLMRSVGYPGQGITADVVLDWEIRRFEIDAQTGVARVEISAKLVDAGGRILAAQIFSAEVPGSADDGVRASAALDKALGRVMQHIVAWTDVKM